MAITILNQPTSPNVSNTNLIYTISSSAGEQFQFRYLADVYESGSSTRLARFKYPENSSGTANIDLGRVFNDYLDYDYNWKISGSQNPNVSNEFTVKFGEEFATSYNGPSTVYEDLTSASIKVFKGSIQYPSITEYDNATNQRIYAASSINFNPLPYTLVSGINRVTNILTNDPSSNQNKGISPYNDLQEKDEDDVTGFRRVKPLGHYDYQTLSYITASNAFFRLNIFDDNNSIVWGTYLVDAPAGGIERGAINSDEFENGRVYTIGVGIPNISASLAYDELTGSLGTQPFSASISSSAQWNYMQLEGPNSAAGNLFMYNEAKGPEVLLSTTTGSRYIASGFSSNEFASLYYPSYCNNEKTRFAFINSFGTWDYYNVYMPTRRSTNIDRKTYEQPNINLDNRIATYNVSNRGEKQYYTEYTDEFEITTDIIDSQQSQWLKEMFESSEVYIQSGSNFLPINILNNRETIINDTPRNKNYQYTIRYQFSNIREPR